MNANSFQNNTDAIARQGDNRLIALHPASGTASGFCPAGKEAIRAMDRDSSGKLVGTVYSK